MDKLWADGGCNASQKPYLLDVQDFVYAYDFGNNVFSICTNKVGVQSQVLRDGDISRTTKAVHLFSAP